MYLKTASCNFSIIRLRLRAVFACVFCKVCVCVVYSKFDKVKNKVKPTYSPYAAPPPPRQSTKSASATRALADHFPVCFFRNFFNCSREKQVSSRCVCHRARQMLRRSNESHATAHATTHEGPLSLSLSSHVSARLPLMRHAVFPNREILRRREQTFAQSSRIVARPASTRNDALARKVLPLFADTFRRKRARDRYVP